MRLAIPAALVVVCAGCTPTSPPPRAAAEPVCTANPTWGPVVLGGGGAVPGIVVHPLVSDLTYIRTDVGGAYRWDEADHRWIPLLDHIPAERWNLYGVESLAVDGQDASGNTVAVALGKYADSWARPQRGRIAISHDRGATWQETGPELAIASNRQQRNGERLAFASGQLWYASMADGLWRSHGATWERVALPGDVTNLTAMATHGTSLWIASAQNGVLESRDDGTTWTALGGVVEHANRLCATADGHLIAVHDNGVHRRDGDIWTAITPPDAPKGIQTVCSDPRDPRRLFAAERISHNARIFRSDDGGATWRIFASARQPSAAWWPQHHWVSSPFAIAFDPQRPGRLWLTDWYAAYRCDDVDAAQPVLTNLVDGIEEIVSLALAVPFGGPHTLMSGVADNGGFDHAHVDTRPASTIWASGGPKGLTCTGIDACPGEPLLAARVGVLGGDRKGPAAGSWTMDGGRTWAPFASVPGTQPAPGRIAVSADGRHLVWALYESQGVFTSSDHGATWRAGDPSLGTAMGKGGVWNWQQPLAADRVAPGTFYLLGGPGLWRSTDGGATWNQGAAVGSDGARAITTHPVRAGVLWLALGGKGLARSDDGGATITRLPALESAELVSSGAGADPDHPLLYVLGRSNGRHGIFISRDLGASCEPLEVPGQAFGNQPNILAGDVRTPGRCFVGSNGRGILWFQVSAVPGSSPAR
jgi:xyloglucan-specific exo-beta-1,4-glucanase